MAAAAKSKRSTSSSNKKTTSTTRKSTSSKPRSTIKHGPAPMPALGLALFGIGLALLFCAITTSNAVAIVAVRSFVYGMCGVMSIPVVLLIMYGGLQIAFGDRWPLRRVVWIQAALILFCVMTLLQVFRRGDILLALSSKGYIQNYNGFLWQSYEASRSVPVGGGSIGGLLAFPMTTYLEEMGSALVLFLAIFSLAFWMIRTLFPSLGERISDSFGEWRDSYMEQREERLAEKEAMRAEAEKEAADAALLVPLPAELTEEPDDEPRAPKRVAKGHKAARPAPQPQTQPVVAAPAPAQQFAAPAPQWQEWEAPMQPPQPIMQARMAPQPAPRPRNGKRPRLYIESDVPIGKPRMAEEAYTEYDAERAKYATRPSRRKDENEIPDFILKRRAEFDAEYGPIGGFVHAESEPYAPRMEEDEPMLRGAQAFTEPPAFELADAPSFDASPIVEEIDYDDDGETATVFMPEPEPEIPVREEAPPAKEKPAPHVARKADPYTLENPLDRQPKLDPAERLDRPNWKPPEPEKPEEEAAVPIEYCKPPFKLLERDEMRMRADTTEADAIGAAKLEETLMSFGVSAMVKKVVHGPAITRYELQPAPGVKVAKIVGLTDDIALNMAAVGVRIEAPIPGKAAVGIEIANDEVQTVHLRDVLESADSQRNPSKLAVALGKDIAGKCIIGDLARMPHLLIAGATGSGKSVCINTLITSIIYRATPEEVRLILVDPKKVELAVYNGVPHLLVPVVTDPKKASGALNWAVMEMDERYKRFAEIGVRDLKGYNSHRPEGAPFMPQIVVIIDELNDLMMVASNEVEDAICRLAQLARACGIHLVIATQRPSVNVITGKIKANVPSRIAFAVSSQVDSRTILDGAGAEKLLGRGDMLYAPSGGGKPLRVQGCFVSDDEVQRVVDYVKNWHTTDYSQAVLDALDTPEDAKDDAAEDEGDVDALFTEAVEMVIDGGQASISMLQRKMRIGYARAGRLIDVMARKGIISEADGAKPREVLMTREMFREQYGK